MSETLAMMLNPDLMQPGQVPGITPVPALAAKSAPLPTTKTSMKYYVCTVPAASLHRTDGKRLGFINGFFQTDILEDQKYLDKECEENIYVRAATADEIKAANMRRDPRGTLKAELRPEIEAEVRSELEAEIRRQVIADLASGKNLLAGAGGVDNKDTPVNITTEGDGVKITETSQPAPRLGGIVGSDKLAEGGAAQSGGVSLSL